MPYITYKLLGLDISLNRFLSSFYCRKSYVYNLQDHDLSLKAGRTLEREAPQYWTRGSPCQHNLSDESLGSAVVEVVGPAARLELSVELVEVVVDGVRAQDLVRDVGTEHDVVLVLQDGRDEARPQLKPSGEGGGERRGGEGEGRGEIKGFHRFCHQAIQELSEYTDHPLFS